MAINKWIPVHASASGLAAMAFLPEPARITNATITDPQVLEDELAKIRRRGYALFRGQRTKGAVAIAAPIWGPNVITHAQRITKNLGGQPPHDAKPKPMSA